MNAKNLSFEQMENLEGGSTYGWVCGGLMYGWGMVLSYGLATAAVSGGISLGVTAVWGGLSWALCSLGSEVETASPTPTLSIPSSTSTLSGPDLLTIH